MIREIISGSSSVEKTLPSALGGGMGNYPIIGRIFTMRTSRTSKTVVNCYDFLDRIFPASGILDLTDGIYNGDPSTLYETAQKNQIYWILDQIGCKKDSRILDIGCGNGTLLEEARRRGAKAIGITISPQQASRCKERGLDVRLLNYRNIGEEWNGCFDGIVANGSIEHFVSPQDVMDGKQDALYPSVSG